MQHFYKNIRDQKGAYMPIMAMGVIALLAMVGLGLDAGNMFYTNLQFQKAADVAVLGTLEYRITEGPNIIYDTNTTQATRLNYHSLNKGYFPRDYNNTETIDLQTALKGVGKDISLTNLYLNMPKIAESIKETNQAEDIDVTFTAPTTDNTSRTAGDEILDINISRKMDYFLMHAIPFGNGKIFENYQGAGLSTGRIRPVRVVLLLDFSNSMECPAEVSDYNETNCSQGIMEIKQSIKNTEQPAQSSIDAVNTYCACPCQVLSELLPSDGYGCNAFTNTNSKLYNLIQGVQEFLSVFRVDKDYISIIPFNLSSYIYKPMSLLTQTDINRWDASNVTTIDGIENWLGEWTNPSDALLTGLYEVMENQSSAANTIAEKTFFVLFTDGSPTAARLLMNNGHDDFNNNPLADKNIENIGGYFDQNITMLASKVSLYQDWKTPGTPSYPLWSPYAFLKSPAPLYSIPTSGQFFGAHLDDLKNLGKVTCSNIPNLDNVQNINGGIEEFAKIFGFDVDNSGNYSGGCFSNSTLSDTASGIMNVYNFELSSFGTSLPFGRGVPLTIGTLGITPDTENLTNIYSSSGKFLRTNEIVSQNYIYSFYDAAILYSDLIRSLNGVVMTIGYGPNGTETPCSNSTPPPGNSSATCSSSYPAYQNIRDAYTRKDYFMARLANSYSSLINNELVGGDWDTSVVDFPGKSWEDLNAEPTDQKGVYIPGKNPEDLKDAFKTIARMIVRLAK